MPARTFARLSLLLAASTAAAQEVPPDLTLVQVTQGLEQPVQVVNAGDGSNRLFIVGLRGKVWVLDPGASTVRTTPFIDIPVCPNPPSPPNPPPPALCVLTNYENGLMGIAFHPDYETNGFLYIHYIDYQDDSVFARVRVSQSDPNRVDLTTLTPILRIDHGFRFHRGGDLAFGPDGFLYIPMGDGSDQGDPCRRGQTLTPAQLAANNGNSGDCPADANFIGVGANSRSRALLSKVIRIDVNNTTPAGSNELCGSNADGSAPYAIPPTNPYAGTNGLAGACDETFSYGWRNPFRFSIDAESGTMFLGDVGNNSQEEISADNLTGTGNRDFGWSNCEGTQSGPNGSCAGSVPPVFPYARSTGYGSSVTGGFVYRGPIYGLRGIYVWSDFTTGIIGFLRRPVPPATAWTNTIWRDTDQSLVSFGVGENGDLYTVDIGGGRIWRFSSTQVGVLFAGGFEP
jgi:glucose/arabinose dehydrogenase